MAELCPFCQSFQDRVDYHIWQLHVGDRFCWCGHEFFRPEKAGRPEISDKGQFRAHCDEHGGYLAHYLECQLGAERG